MTVRPVLLMAVAFCATALAQVPTVSVRTSTGCISDLGQTRIASGTFALLATDGNDGAVPVGGGGFQATAEPTTRQITNGSIPAISIANPALSSPSPVFRITITNNATRKLTTYRKVGIAVSTGTSTWDWCAFQPGTVLPAIAANYVYGPKGDKGDAGVSGTSAVVTSNGTNGAFSVPGVLTAGSVKAIFNSYPGVILSGDSITAGDGASDYANAPPYRCVANCYAQLMKSDYGGTFMNDAFPGDEAADMNRKIFAELAPTDSRNPLAVAMIGTNEAHRYPGNTDVQVKYTLTNTASFAWRTIPRSRMVWGQQSACTGFTPDNSLQSGLAVASSTNGSCSFSLTTNGAPLVMAWRIIDGQTGSANLSCDGGGITDSYSTSIAGGVATTNGATHAVAARYYPTPAGTHSCQLTSTGYFSFVFAGSPDTTLTQVGAPRLVVAGVLRELDDASAASTAVYNTLQQNLVTGMALAGFHIAFADVRSYVNATTDYAGSSDPGEHPNDTGHRHLRDCMEFAAFPSFSGASVTSSTSPNFATATPANVASYPNTNPANYASPTALDGGINVYSSVSGGAHFGLQLGNFVPFDIPGSPAYFSTELYASGNDVISFAFYPGAGTPTAQSNFTRGSYFNPLGLHTQSLTLNGTSTLRAVDTLTATDSTPPVIAPQSCMDHALAVPGMVALENLNSPAISGTPIGNLSLLSFASSVANQVILHFCNPTAVAVTAPADTYTWIGLR